MEEVWAYGCNVKMRLVPTGMGCTWLVSGSSLFPLQSVRGHIGVWYNTSDQRYDILDNRLFGFVPLSDVTPPLLTIVLTLPPYAILIFPSISPYVGAG